jgi:hypothetical protein
VALALMYRRSGRARLGCVPARKWDRQPSGYGIPYLALVDGIVAYKPGTDGARARAESEPAGEAARASITLILSFFLALGSLVLILVRS